MLQELKQAILKDEKEHGQRFSHLRRAFNQEVAQQQAAASSARAAAARRGQPQPQTETASAPRA